jgi:hypothetical protein
MGTTYLNAAPSGEPFHCVRAVLSPFLALVVAIFPVKGAIAFHSLTKSTTGCAPFAGATLIS